MEPVTKTDAFRNVTATPEILDKNIANYPKESNELIKLCKKACDRIAKEIK